MQNQGIYKEEIMATDVVLGELSRHRCQIFSGLKDSGDKYMYGLVKAEFPNWLRARSDGVKHRTLLTGVYQKLMSRIGHVLYTTGNRDLGFTYHLADKKIAVARLETIFKDYVDVSSHDELQKDDDRMNSAASKNSKRNEISSDTTDPQKIKHARIDNGCAGMIKSVEGTVATTINHGGKMITESDDYKKQNCLMIETKQNCNDKEESIKGKDSITTPVLSASDNVVDNTATANEKHPKVQQDTTPAANKVTHAVSHDSMESKKKRANFKALPLDDAQSKFADSGEEAQSFAEHSTSDILTQTAKVNLTQKNLDSARGIEDHAAKQAKSADDREKEIVKEFNAAVAARRLADIRLEETAKKYTSVAEKTDAFVVKSVAIHHGLEKALAAVETAWTVAQANMAILEELTIAIDKSKDAIQHVGLKSNAMEARVTSKNAQEDLTKAAYKKGKLEDLYVAQIKALQGLFENERKQLQAKEHGIQIAKKALEMYERNHNT